MKYLYFLLATSVFISCSNASRGNQVYYTFNADEISNPAEDVLLTIPETSIETFPENPSVKGVNAGQYTFEIVNGTYWDMNDLTYFLSDTSLKSLSLYKGTFHDLSPLAELTALEELEISSNRYITDISPIGSLVNLKKLILFNCLEIKSIEALSSLVNLRYLNLVYKDKYYGELLPLQKLEVLELYNISPSQLDVSYIAQLQSLKELSVNIGNDDDSIMNIRQLENLINLKKIYIRNVIDLDISWITQLQKLNEVFFENCKINDISPLVELPDLIEVRLWRSTVNDLSPLLESRSIKSITGFVLNNDNRELTLSSLFWDRSIEFAPFWSDR
jgi:Leucine-rich repeat (LRR) protein